VELLEIVAEEFEEILVFTAEFNCLVVFLKELITEVIEEEFVCCPA